MPTLTAPSRYVIPEVERGMLAKLWNRLDDGQKGEIIKIDQNQVLYELGVKFSQMYGQGAYLESFSDHLKPINLYDALLCAKHVFSEQLKTDTTSIQFDDSIFQASVNLSILDHSKQCYACERDNAVYTFTDDGEGTLIHGITTSSAHSLALFFWASVNVLMKRVAVVGESPSLIEAGFSSVPQMRTALAHADPYKAVLNQAIKLKEEGNNLFREKRWDLANEKYTQAIECSCQLDASRLTYFSNRALCSLFMASEEIEDQEQRIEYLSNAVLDCSKVLQTKNSDIKALYRRAKAFLELSEFKRSSNDISQLLSINPEQDDARQLLFRLVSHPQNFEVVSYIEGSHASKPTAKKAPKKKTANGKKKKKKPTPEPTRQPQMQIPFSKMLEEDPVKAIEEFNKASTQVAENRKREEEEQREREALEKGEALRLKEEKERKEREKRERKEELRKLQELRERDRRERELREADERERLRIERETVIREKEKTDRRIKEEVDKRLKEERAREEDRRRITKEKERLRRQEKEEERKKKKAIKKEQKAQLQEKPPLPTPTPSANPPTTNSQRNKNSTPTTSKVVTGNVLTVNGNISNNRNNRIQSKSSSHLPAEELPLHKRKIEPPRRSDQCKVDDVVDVFEYSESTSQFHFDIGLFQRYSDTDVQHPTVPPPPAHNIAVAAPPNGSPSVSCLDIETLFQELQGSFSTNNVCVPPPDNNQSMFPEPSTEGFICPPPPMGAAIVGVDPWRTSDEEVYSNANDCW